MTRYSIVLILTFTAIGALVAVSSVWSQPEGERGMTEEQLRELVKRELGTPLFYDRHHKLAVAYQSNPDGSANTIHIAPDPTGPEVVGIKYELGKDKGRSIVTYSGDISPQSKRAAIWRDLNADGVFDQLLIPFEHNELLKLGRGVYLLLDGKWAAAQHEDDMPRDTFKVHDVIYRFEPAAGKWQPIAP